MPGFSGVPRWRRLIAGLDRGQSGGATIAILSVLFSVVVTVLARVALRSVPGVNVVQFSARDCQRHEPPIDRRAGQFAARPGGRPQHVPGLLRSRALGSHSRQSEARNVTLNPGAASAGRSPARKRPAVPRYAPTVRRTRRPRRTDRSSHLRLRRAAGSGQQHQQQTGDAPDGVSHHRSPAISIPVTASRLPRSTSVHSPGWDKRQRAAPWVKGPSS